MSCPGTFSAQEIDLAARQYPPIVGIRTQQIQPVRAMVSRPACATLFAAQQRSGASNVPVPAQDPPVIALSPESRMLDGLGVGKATQLDCVPGRFGPI